MWSMQAPSCMQNGRTAHQGEALQAFMHACIQCSIQSCTISMPAHEAPSAQINVIRWMACLDHQVQTCEGLGERSES